MSTIDITLSFLDMIKLSERLRKLRSERKLTQTRLAQLLDINPRVYNRWEQGDSIPHVDTLIKIADTLQVSLDELVGRTAAASKPVLHNPKLQEIYKELDWLSDEEQQMVVVFLDSLIKRNKFSEILRE